MIVQRSNGVSGFKLGQTFRCLVCGSETFVIRAGGGELRPVCCNQPMVPLKKSTEMYGCSVCGSEVAVINSKKGNLRLICCNVPMRVLVANPLEHP